MAENIFKQLPEVLLPWYYANKRDLPWRADRKPYHVWLSEIMLQQTRVEAVKGYYRRFLETLPTIEDLANCDDDTLHKLWEGLGYYTRVRNLKKTAQTIVQMHGGCFPQTHQEVLALPGIGSYTAGAICSICYDLPTPAVDGNVLRVVTRLTEDATPIDLPAYKKQIEQQLQAVYPSDAGGFTQALMELGATVCGPNRSPDCAHCPCRDFCMSAAHGTAESFPVKLPKRQRREEEKTVLILRCEDRYALTKRPARGLLAGLWQFPDMPGFLSAQDALDAASAMGLKPKGILRQTKRSHIFTHVVWHMQGFYLEVSEAAECFHWMTPQQINEEAALPTAYRQFWEEQLDV